MSRLSISELYILLIEPSATQRRIIESKIREVGNEHIESVSTPDDAWESMKSATPDLVVSCMYFDRMTGCEFLQRIRADEQLKDVPFMLISSETRFENLEPAKQAGVMAILPKPFSVSDLKMALQATAEYIDPEEFDLDDFDAENTRVLVVDDSPTARKHISNLLRKMGMQKITLAKDGLEAIEKLNNSMFDIVITDFNMPKMDGERLTSYIRNHSEQSSIPIMMVTSENNEARLDSVLKSGVSAICDKPFDSAHVKSLLSQLLH